MGPWHWQLAILPPPNCTLDTQIDGECIFVANECPIVLHTILSHHNFSHPIDGLYTWSWWGPTHWQYLCCLEMSHRLAHYFCPIYDLISLEYTAKHVRVHVTAGSICLTPYQNNEKALYVCCHTMFWYQSVLFTATMVQNTKISELLLVAFKCDSCDGTLQWWLTVITV